MSFDTIRTNEIIKYIGKPNVLIIDLRDRHEYNSGHIPGAVNVPYEELESHSNQFSKGKLAASDLMKYGYNIKSLYGGLRAYHGTLDKS
jgi:rhodanese-related sulfurtransferase